MTKPTSTTKKPRKQHTPEFRQEAAASWMMYVTAYGALVEYGN
ncbi:hypothetical protein, partial [Klebsiella pneumoniae]